MAEMASMEEVATTNAVGHKPGVWVIGNGLQLCSRFGGEALVGVNHEKPGILVFDLSYTPGAMVRFVAAKSL